MIRILIIISLFILGNCGGGSQSPNSHIGIATISANGERINQF